MKKSLLLCMLAISTHNHTMEEGLIVSAQDTLKENIKKQDHVAIATFLQDIKEKPIDDQKGALASINFDNLTELAEKKAQHKFPWTSYIAWAAPTGMLMFYTYLAAQNFSQAAIECNRLELDQKTNTYHSYCPEPITNRLHNEYFNWTFTNNVILAGFGIGNLAMFLALKHGRIPSEKTLQNIKELSSYKQTLSREHNDTSDHLSITEQDQ